MVSGAYLLPATYGYDRYLRRKQHHTECPTEDIDAISAYVNPLKAQKENCFSQHNIVQILITLIQCYPESSFTEFSTQNHD